jgi:hypothetical protein
MSNGWTSEVPIVAGVYWWRVTESDPIECAVEIAPWGAFYEVGRNGDRQDGSRPSRWFGGLWRGPLKEAPDA